jgi:hypothetical protein
MARWHYYDDPDCRNGDVIMTSRDYKPSWAWRRYVELRSWWINMRRPNWYWRVVVLIRVWRATVR